jgi:transcriptional regulator with XRE-family HTH domain
VILNIPEFDHSFLGTKGCQNVVKELMSRHNITVAELARRINLPQPTIHRLLTGKTEDPRLSTLSLIANYFSITIDQLLGYTPLTSESGTGSSLSRLVPILSWHDAIDHEKMITSLTRNNWCNWLLVGADVSSLTFSLKSKKSMEPRFPAGSILLIDPGVTPSDGDLMVVRYPNTTEATIRELVSDGPSQALLSIIDNSISDELTNDIKLIGVIMETRFSNR